jgi:hypothetical protein
LAKRGEGRFYDNFKPLSERILQVHFFISLKLWLYGKIAKNRIRAGYVALGGVEKT